MVDQTSNLAAGPGEPSVPSQRLTAWQLLLAVLVALAVTAIWRIVVPQATVWCCDASQYLRMAQDPSQGVATPFAYRLVVPRLAHLLGGVPQVTFARIWGTRNGLYCPLTFCSGAPAPN